MGSNGLSPTIETMSITSLEIAVKEQMEQYLALEGTVASQTNAMAEMLAQQIVGRANRDWVILIGLVLALEHFPLMLRRSRPRRSSWCTHRR